MVAESAGKPAQAEEALKEAQQASTQEIQSLKSSLNQAQCRTMELEAQVDSMQKVIFLKLHFVQFNPKSFAHVQKLALE